MRRFKRVHFKEEVGPAHRILGARLSWANLEVSDVYDLSLRGFAVGRPALVELIVGSEVEVQVEFGEAPPFAAPVRVVWLRDDLVGLELGDLNADALLQMHVFINDKLIGQSMVRVDQKYFAKEADFQYWFVGADSTNLFVWCDPEDGRTTKLRLEFGDDVWQFENRRVTSGEMFNRRALQVLGHLTAPEVRLNEAIEKVAASE